MEDEKVVLTKAEHQELVEKLANETQAKANLVNEVKELREKKQLSESEVAELKVKNQELEALNKGENPEVDVEKVVETILTKKAIEDTKKTQENIKAKFRETHKEFHPDNDAGSIKLGVFERVVGRFNTSDLSNEEYSKVLEDAYALMNKETKEPNTPGNNYSEKNTPSNPPVSDDNVLTPKEEKLIASTFGGDRERYLKQKAKRPDYIEQLLTYAR